MKIVVAPPTLAAPARGCKRHFWTRARTHATKIPTCAQEFSGADVHTLTHSTSSGTERKNHRPQPRPEHAHIGRNQRTRPLSRLATGLRIRPATASTLLRPYPPQWPPMGAQCSAPAAPNTQHRRRPTHPAARGQDALPEARSPPTRGHIAPRRTATLLSRNAEPHCRAAPPL